MSGNGLSIFEQTLEMTGKYLDAVTPIHEKSKKWYFRPSMADFDYLFSAVLHLLKVVLNQASLIASSDKVITGYEQEVAEKDREIARLERKISSLTEAIEYPNSKFQAKEEK